MSLDNASQSSSNLITKEEQLQQDIKTVQEKEISYVLEASQADDRRTKYLAKKNEYNIIFDDGHEETFKRKPLSSKKNKEIDDLRSSFTNSRFNRIGNNSIKEKLIVNGREFENQNDVLFEAFRLTAEYCLGMSSDQYDNAIWEDDEEYIKEKEVYGLRSILIACLLRAVHGIVYFRPP